MAITVAQSIMKMSGDRKVIGRILARVSTIYTCSKKLIYRIYTVARSCLSQYAFSEKTARLSFLRKLSVKICRFEILPGTVATVVSLNSAVVHIRQPRVVLSTLSVV